MGRYSALTVAKWFINKNIRVSEDCNSEEITLLKVLKLLYYAEGCSLALGKGSLFSDPIVAWEHGPVVESVYNYYKKDPYHLPFGTDQDYDDIQSISEEDNEMLADVYNEFGQYTAWGLRNLTHSEKPWKEATNNGQILNKEISRETMKRYFAKHYIYDDEED